MSKENTSLHKAKDAKNDEWYTRFEDISAEVSRYADQLRGKVIYCPCDWDESYERVVCYEDGAPVEAVVEKIKSTKCNFINFLLNQADAYGIKKIIASGYNPKTKRGIRFQDADYSDVDIVITNPPYSQFREFIDVMFQNKLKFLVIGSLNTITYKDCFAHIKNNEMWLGYAKKLSGFVREDGSIAKKGNDCWYTNLEVSYRHDRLILTEEYSPAQYPKYDNYDAIEVGRQRDIPADYDGVMGLPISFLQNYNPDQFELLALGIVGSCEFTCNKKMELLDKKGNPTGKYTYNAKGTLYRAYNPHVDKKPPAFKNAETGELYSSIFARVLVRRKGVCNGNEN